MCRLRDPRFGACGGTMTQLAAVGWPLFFLYQDYYGRELQKSEDLKTNACITVSRPVPKAVRDALQLIHEEVVARYYGCGLIIPECLVSCRVLDLGSGSGRDCYVLSQLVGERGYVTGIDMTKEQVEVAKKHIAYHMEKFGYQKPNVEFLQGYMEKLGECLAGALFWEDLYSIAKEVGFSPPCLVTASPITIGSKELEDIIGDCSFVSATFRLFKVPGSSWTGPGQVIYNAGHPGLRVPESSLVMFLSPQEGAVVDVDAEMAAILRSSRFAEKFMIRSGGTSAAAPQGCCQGKMKVGSCVLGSGDGDTAAVYYQRDTLEH
ncbi:hypothetical protein ASZ78_010467 [Callipepla squamata]|uniref:Arsenite methyltransferase n=1 Tax=Callipepla squamata TaxID=9009 RepID=A0A226MSG4_CALSU|nr:hypothetical protein ASZ78_010467 [Callipepla squamata]